MRFFRRFTFLPVVLILAGFVVAVFWLSRPPKSEESPPTVRGTITASSELKPDAPLVYFVGLNPGATKPPAQAPEFPLDDAQPDAGETFELVAEEGDGSRFWVLARVETARIERWCKSVDVPPLRRQDDGTWVVASTGKPLPALRITVDKTTPCE
ncbi:MAG TPA: hypothetical protein VIA10_06960 [Gaiellaceae bacterium]